MEGPLSTLSFGSSRPAGTLGPGGRDSTGSLTAPSPAAVTSRRSPRPIKASTRWHAARGEIETVKSPAPERAKAPVATAIAAGALNSLNQLP